MITLKTLPDATAQEVFDQVKNHLLTQNAKSEQFYSTGESPVCKYRHGELKCAAGCLIGDDEYKASMDESGGWDVLMRHGDVPHNHAQLIIRLQNIHDGCEPADWPKALSNLATELGLNP